jgi:hypothetical protein
MRRLFFILSTLSMAITLIMPAAAHAANATDVYVSKSADVITEDQALNYYAIVNQNGYVNQNWFTSQGSREDRMNTLRQMAIEGFDINSVDPYLYSVLLPNTATLAQVKTWFGHPVDMIGGQYVIHGWFGPGDDAVVIPSVIDDIRTSPSFTSSL